MSDVSARYRVVADGFTARLRGVRPDQWTAGTPCPDWTVRDLAVHPVAVHRRFLSRLDGSEPAPVDPGDDPLVLWQGASAAMLEALEDDARAGKLVHGGFGDMPFESLVDRVVFVDTLVHTWDLARATGQDERLDPAAVATATGYLTRVGDAIRQGGAFGPAVEPPPDADEQTRLLSFCGRQV